MTHIFFNENEVAEILGIEPDQIGFAIRRGDLCLPDAIGIHGLRLWSLNTLMLNPLVQARFPQLTHEYANITFQKAGIELQGQLLDFAEQLGQGRWAGKDSEAAMHVVSIVQGIRRLLGPLRESDGEPVPPSLSTH